jgi:hypothetical protein
MPREWQPVVQGDDFSDVMRLVHLAMRETAVDVEQMRGELLKQRVVAYESELGIQAERVGCPGRRGRLTTGESLTLLNDESRADAESIVNTYNADMAIAIQAIRNETPTANRYVYAKRLEEWNDKRAKWKEAQIQQYTTGTARALAQQDFYRYNDQIGVAVLAPKDAVCPVCQGWIRRGEVPLREAMNNPPPYHVNCPHLWGTKPNKVAREECPMLWMGA